MRGPSAPERLETERLVLRRPRLDHAEEIFARYASDPDVTRFVGWRTHQSIRDTRAFLAFCDSEWERWPAGAYLAFQREGGALVGSTGLNFETPFRAATGYVLAKSMWGQGYATECLRAMVSLAQDLRVRRLYALCHVDHEASAHVLEKCGFDREAVMRRYAEFPNIQPHDPCDVLCYVRLL